MEQMAYIGSFAPANSVLVARKESPAKTVDEMRTIASTVGCSGVTSQSFQYPAMLKVLAGFKFRMVCGYPGSAEYLLALEKGEVDLVSNAWNATRITHLKQVQIGEMPAVVQFGLKRHRELPAIPLMQELVTDADAKAAILFASAGAAIGRALLAPPGIPPERIAYLRAMFDKMVSDPELMEMAKRRGLELDPTGGAEVQKILEEIIKTPKDVLDRAAKAMAG
jgi:tripartite-type tricarboxylate transporter receptor subunit TctC